MNGDFCFQEIAPIVSNDARHIIIAGPCSAESEIITLETAYAVHKLGVNVFRAGVWKPRTNPDSYAGPGSDGLKWLKRVKDETGMLVATEVANANHVREALEASVDVLWIGARTTANPFAVQEIADALADYDSDVAVLVKNPVNPDIDLWIGGIQRLYYAGVRRLAAVHRGFSSFGQHLYRNEPQWQIPIELKRRAENLPIICDPSHMGGRPDLISPLSQQALDMGFDGLMIECHCRPQEALSDKEQQISPAQLKMVLESLVVRHRNTSSEELGELRRQIDQCDDELVDVLSRRMQLCRKIGELKKEQNMTVVQTHRYDEILERRKSQAKALGMNPEFMQTVMQAIHEEAVRTQVEILQEKSSTDVPKID